MHDGLIVVVSFCVGMVFGVGSMLVWAGVMTLCNREVETDAGHADGVVNLPPSKFREGGAI